MAQISMAWILGKPGVTAPIVGTTSLKNLEDILGESCNPLMWTIDNVYTCDVIESLMVGTV